MLRDIENKCYLSEYKQKTNLKNKVATEEKKLEKEEEIFTESLCEKIDKDEYYYFSQPNPS